MQPWLKSLPATCKWKLLNGSRAGDWAVSAVSGPGGDHSLVHTAAATPLGSEQCMLRAFWHSICCKRKRMILVIQERIMSQSAAAALRIPDTRKHINTRVERLPQTRFLKICILADSWCLSTDERMSLEMDCTYHLLTGKVFRPWAASWAWHQCPESWWCCNLWPKLVWGGQQWAVSSPDRTCFASVAIILARHYSRAKHYSASHIHSHLDSIEKESKWTSVKLKP